MMATELIAALQVLVDEHGDKVVKVDDCFALQDIGEVDLAAKDDDGIVIWTEI